MRSDHKETGASKKKFKYKRLGPIHVMGKYNLARYALRVRLSETKFFSKLRFFGRFWYKVET